MTEKNDRLLTGEELDLVKAGRNYRILLAQRNYRDKKITQTELLADLADMGSTELGICGAQDAKTARMVAEGIRNTFVKDFVEMAINLYITDDKNKKYAWEVWHQIDKTLKSKYKGE